MLTDDVISTINKVASNKGIQLCILSAMMSGQYKLDTDLWEALEQDKRKFPTEITEVLWGMRHHEDDGEARGLYAVTPPHEVIQKLVDEVHRLIRINAEYTYNVNLGDISPGLPFKMVNYAETYMRVKANLKYVIVRDSTMSRKEHAFDDDGEHVPIVNLDTGELAYMSKIKPCRLYLGESPRRRV